MCPHLPENVPVRMPAEVKEPDAFVWDGHSRYLVVEGNPLTVSNIWVLWSLADDMPIQYEGMDLMPPDDPDALAWVVGWEAVLPLGDDNRAVLVIESKHGLATNTVEATVQLGPDPHAAVTPHCAVRGSYLVPADSLAMAKGYREILRAVMASHMAWKATLKSRGELFAVIRYLSNLTVKS